MKSTALRSTVLIVVMTFAVLGLAMAQSETVEREFDHPIDDLRQSLEALQASQTRKLPTVRGFVTDNLALGTYERPYYQFETELVPRNADRTLLRVKARITAWHTGSSTMEEYRSLTSNGRLESDFLEQVSRYLVTLDSDLTSRIVSLEKMLGDLKSKTDALEKRCLDLTRENKRLEEAIQSQSESRRQRMVLRSGTHVVDQPSAAAHTLLTAERDDLFEVADERPGWVGVKLDGDTTGWLRSRDTKPVTASSDQTVLSAALKEKQAPFVITRETVTPFLGEWPSLKGQRALFLWAQPVGLSRAALTEKLSFVKQLFAYRYRDALHSQVDYAGLVVIFMGNGKNGVAAARLDDIGQWLNGKMPDKEFIGRCSLDPMEAFHAAH